MVNQSGAISSFCGFMLDSARCQESRAYYRNVIDFAADRGVNALLWHFSDDQGCSLILESVPGISSPNAYSKEEMRELIAYARDRGIQIVPELASLGHCRYLTRLPAYQHLNETDSHFTGMCPVSRETRTVIKALIEETIEIFESENFHVGMDEVNIGEHPLTQAALQTHTRAELLADYVQFLHGVVSAKGRRMWMWGDMLLKYPQMLAQIPVDVLICNWQYEPHALPVTTQILLDAGFDVMLCSALISHDQPLFPGDRFAVPNIRTLESKHALTGKGKLTGHINTIWTPVRFMADSLWVGIDLAAAILRGESGVDAAMQAARFGKDFYGFTDNDSSQFAEVVAILFEHSPLRKEWLAVAKLSPLSTAMLASVKAASTAFARAHDLLSNLSTNVRNHFDEYRTFSLLVEMLDHTYSAAVRVPTIEMVWRGQEIIQRIDDTWDQERFAEDPRKYVASHRHFQDDHLIPLLGLGLAALKKKLDESESPELISDQKLNVTTSQAYAV